MTFRTNDTLYIITCEHMDGDTHFWSNEHGWFESPFYGGDITIYSQDERDSFSLPFKDDDCEPAAWRPLTIGMEERP